MKKYKLKKWYPGCGDSKKGDIVKRDGEKSNVYESEIPTYFSRSQIENNPEYWQLLCDKCNKPIKKGENITFIKTDCVCNKKPLFTTEDGVDIFKGDEYWNVNVLFNIKHIPNCYNFRTEKEYVLFNSLNDNNCFSTKEAAEEYIDSKKPTFIMTTEDGKKLYSNMTETLYGVTLSPAHVDDTILTKEFKQGVGDFRGWRKWFYDTGAAEEYLLYNKPVLSLMDVAGIYVTANPNRKTPIKYRSQRDRLLKLIKSKLYGKDK